MEINSDLELLNDSSKQQLDEIRLLVEREKSRERYKVLCRKNRDTADRLGRQYREYRASKIQETFLNVSSQTVRDTIQKACPCKY